MSSQKPTIVQLHNRFNYHAPKGDQADRYERIRRYIRDTAARCVDHVVGSKRGR